MGLFSFFKKEENDRQSGPVIDVTDQNFDRQVIQRSYIMPVLVDFWAAWCGPCQVLDPILIKLAAAPQSGFVLARLDTEQNQRTTQRYHIQSIPTVMMFRGGQAVASFHGLRPEPLVKRFVSKALDQPPLAPDDEVSPAAPEQRLAQARQHLANGRGFEAAILLEDFPQSAERAEAEALLPVARFLFDMELGDAYSGDEHIDRAYRSLAKSLRRRKYDTALEQLAAIDEAQEAKGGIDVQGIQKGIAVLRDGG